LHWDDQGGLVDMDYELDQSARKLEQYSHFCQENGFSVQDCLVLGDSENDEKLFEVSKYGVLIGGDSENETFAWQRIAQLADFEQILRDY
jgi:phosphoserine phosphatase